MALWKHTQHSRVQDITETADCIGNKLTIMQTVYSQLADIHSDLNLFNKTFA